MPVSDCKVWKTLQEHREVVNLVKPSERTCIPKGFSWPSLDISWKG